MQPRHSTVIVWLRPRVPFTLQSIVLGLLRLGDSKSFPLLVRDVFAKDDPSKPALRARPYVANSHVAPFSLPAADCADDWRFWRFGFGLALWFGPLSIEDA